VTSDLAAAVATHTLAWIPILEPMPWAHRIWWLFAIPLALGMSMAWKAVRLPSLEHYWRAVFVMTGQILLTIVGIAVGLFVIVVLLLPHLPAE
jgi:hypothetical protein